MKNPKKQFLRGEIKAGEAGEIFSGIASSGRRDRDGDTIDQGGWKLDDYNKNPVLLWGHNPYIPPIGKTSNLRFETGLLKFDFEFAKTDMGNELKALVKDGFLNTFSVGFIPHDFGNEKEGQATFTEQELLEISLVTIPSNPDAMVTSRSFGNLSAQTKSFLLGEISRHKMIVDHEARSFPSSEATWDEDAERRAAEIDDLKVMATYVKEESPNDKASYQLLHHSRSKDYPLSKAGLDAAVDGLGEIPENLREAAYAHLKDHYDELGLEAPAMKGKSATADEVKDLASNLAVEDRKLLQRVADVLEKIEVDALKKTPEAKPKVARSGRGENKGLDMDRVMTRALQLVSRVVSKRLGEIKRNR